MIEIKEGWTGKEASTQHEVGMLNYEIASLNRKLEAVLEKRAKLQEICEHKHVSFSGQVMTCEVCTLRIDK